MIRSCASRCRDATDQVAFSHMTVLLADRAAGLAAPPVLQLDDPVAGGGAGDQVELVGLWDAVEQPGARARNVGNKLTWSSFISTGNVSLAREPR
jgi:hypothetical protein